MRIFFITVLFSSLLFSFSYTQNQNLFAQATQAKSYIDALLKSKNLQAEPKNYDIKGFDRPSFIYYKLIQLYHLLNRYRVQNRLGQISIPHFPPNVVTPQDVQALLEDFTNQLKLLHPKRLSSKEFVSKGNYNKLYKLLLSLEYKLSLLTGKEHQNPTDVYQKARYLLDNIIALRDIQLQMDRHYMPKRKEEQLSNHSLYASQHLLKQINIAKQNLWMPTHKVAKAPQRMITPFDVSMSLDKALTEIEEIKQRLGLRYEITQKEIKGVKFSTDVVQILEYSRTMMPIFKLESPIIQKPPRSSLTDIRFALEVGNYLLDRLTKQKAQSYLLKIKPDISYNDLKKYALLLNESYILINKARKKLGLGQTTLPSYKTPISAQDIGNTLLRLDDEVRILQQAKKENALQPYLNYRTQAKQEPKIKDLEQLLYRINDALKKRYDIDLSLKELYISSANILHTIKTIIKAYHPKAYKKFTYTKKNIFTDTNPLMVEQKIIFLHKKLMHIEARANMTIKPIAFPKDILFNTGYLFHMLAYLNSVANDLAAYFQIRTIPIDIKTRRNYTLDDIYYLLDQTEALLTLLYDKG